MLESRRTCFFLCKTAATLQNCHHQSKGFKGSNKQFHGWLFFNFSNIIPISSMRYCVISSPRPPPPPPADSIFHPACSPLIPPPPTKGVSPCPLTYSFRLTCPSFLMLTRLKLAFQFPTLKRRTLQDVEQGVLKIWQASLKSRRVEPCPRYSGTPGDYCCFQNILEM